MIRQPVFLPTMEQAGNKAFRHGIKNLCCCERVSSNELIFIYLKTYL